MAALTHALVEALQTDVSKIFKKGYGEGPDHSALLATVVQSNTLVQTYAWMKRVLQAREWLGPRQIQNLDTIATNLANKDFELTVGVDKNEIADDMLGMFTSVVEELARQMKYIPTSAIIDLMIQGNVAGNVGFDGQVFFSAAHDLDPAGNQSNVGSTALSATSWEATRATMQQYTGEDGRPMGINPNLIVVPPQLEGTAKALLTAERNANGSTNINKGEASYLVIPELTDVNDWYALDTTKGIKPFLWQNREDTSFTSLTAATSENVFMLKRLLWGAERRGNAGYGPWWLAFKHVVA